MMGRLKVEKPVFLLAAMVLFSFESSTLAQGNKEGAALQQKRPVDSQKAQENTTEGEESSSSLTDGLLDLLGEPEVASDASKDAKPSISPKDVGLDGEDLGEKQDDPLVSVRQSMVIAAEFLNRGVTGGTTQTLQGDIVQRLDDLIQQIEDAQQDASKQSSGEQNSQSDQQETQRQQSNAETQTQSTESEQNQDQTSGRDNPGNDGEKKALRTDLVDPGKLQLEVWGQLPERIRKQMQSRMVEQFLPSYRDRIQSYFESLLREDDR